MAWYNSTDGDAVVNGDTGAIIRREPRDGGRKAIVLYTGGGTTEIAFGVAATVDTKFSTIKTNVSAVTL